MRAVYSLLAAASCHFALGGAYAFEMPPAPISASPAPEPTAFDDLRLVDRNAPPFRFSKTLFRWAGQAPNYETGGPEKIVTDRPHFSEASSLVGLGRVQLETGYTIFRDEDAGTVVHTQSFPEPLLRVGMLAEWFEFRLAYNYLDERTSGPLGTQSLSGSDDIYLGAKLALTEQHGALPEMAIFPQMRVPTGCSAFTSGEVLPGFNFAYSWMLNDWIELECNSQMNRRLDDGGHYYTEAIQTANIEYELSEKLNAFTEWFVFVPSGAVSAQTQHYFHGGFWYLVTPNIQFDIHAGVGLSHASDDLAFTGVGFSCRY